MCKDVIKEQVGTSTMRLSFKLEQGSPTSYFNAFFNVTKEAVVEGVKFYDDSDAVIKDLNITTFGEFSDDIDGFTDLKLYENYQLKITYKSADSSTPSVDKVCTSVLGGFKMEGLMNVEAMHFQPEQTKNSEININFDISKVMGATEMYNRDIAISEM